MIQREAIHLIPVGPLVHFEIQRFRREQMNRYRLENQAPQYRPENPYPQTVKMKRTRRSEVVGLSYKGLSEGDKDQIELLALDMKVSNLNHRAHELKDGSTEQRVLFREKDAALLALMELRRRGVQGVRVGLEEKSRSRGGPERYVSIFTEGVGGYWHRRGYHLPYNRFQELLIETGIDFETLVGQWDFHEQYQRRVSGSFPK